LIKVFAGRRENEGGGRIIHKQKLIFWINKK